MSMETALEQVDERYKVLKNGAVYDMVEKRIVSGAKTSLITAENAREYQSRAVAKKRLVMAQAANATVENPQLIEQYGDYAHVAERAQTLQRIASTPEAGKAAVMAHQALTLDTGMGEKQAQEAGAAAVTPLAQALHGLIALMQGVDNYPYRKHNPSQADTVDGVVSPAGAVSDAVGDTGGGG